MMWTLDVNVSSNEKHPSSPYAIMPQLFRATNLVRILIEYWPRYNQCYSVTKLWQFAEVIVSSTPSNNYLILTIVFVGL